MRYTRDLVRKLSWQFELGSEFQTLSYGHSLEQDIILLNVGGQRGEIADVSLVLSVDKDITFLFEVL